MRKNNKGFTLIEIIGVVVILSLILLISVPALTKTLKRNEQKKYDSYVNNLKTAAETYLVKNINKYPELQSEDGGIYISISTLISEGYIKKIEQSPDGIEADAVFVKLGINNKYDYEIVNAAKLSDKVALSLSGCTKSGNTFTGECYYKGKDVNNYVWYGGFLWHIVDIDQSGNIKLITEDNITLLNVAYDDFSSWLNNYQYGMYKVLPENVKNNIVKTTYSIPAATTCGNSSSTITTNVTMLTYDEFTRTFTQGSGSDSYLIKPYFQYGFWLANQNCYTYSYGMSVSTKTMGYSTIRPVITISANTLISGGNGTSVYPYTIIGDEPLKVNDSVTNLKVGEYLSIKDGLYRVVDMTNDRVKVVQDYVSDKTGSFTSASQAKISQNKEIGEYLDSRTQRWYSGAFKTQSYTNVTSSVSNNNSSLGFLSYADIFASYDNAYYNYYLENISDSYYHIITASAISSYSVTTSYAFNYRFAAYISPLLKISGGSGTKNSPYKIIY